MNVTRYKCSVLAIDDDPAVLSVLARQLSSDFDVMTATTAEEGREVLSQRSVDIVLCDLQLPDGSGLKLLDWLRRTAPRTARVLITGGARVEDTVDAINHSQVHRLVLKPWRVDDLMQTLRTISRSLLLERSHEQLLDELRTMNEDLERRVQIRTAELELVNAQLHQKTAELERANALLHEKQLELEKLATTDSLTGLWNRREIENIAMREIDRRNRTPSPLTLILIDADHFGQVNRDYSLTAGDQVLRWLTGVLRSSIRTTDSLGRVGGEEFMVVAPATDQFGAEVLAERLRANVEGSQTVYNCPKRGPVTLRMTISVGVAVADANTTIDYEQLRAIAADAETDAKGTGRNKVVLRVLAEPPAV